MATKRPRPGGAAPSARSAKRPARRTASRARKRPGPLTSKPAVRVRMYRQGLGDCFLLTFGADGPRPRHVLIDCGSLGSTTTGVAIADVFEDIRKTTRGRLDVLVATHEHKDHVSGFKPASFKGLTVDRVWLAWTEDPSDAMAQRVAKRKQDLTLALQQASLALKASAAGVDRDAAAALDDVLEFAGDADKLGAADFAKTINEAMSFVRTTLTKDVTYWKPGTTIEESWLPGFRIYVLGPPRNEAALGDTGEDGGDLFALAALRSGAAFRASGKPARDYAAALSAEARDEFIAGQPFDQRFRLESERYQQEQGLASSYDAADATWRRIDADWLSRAPDLALQLDSATNNTSLALAIERIADGRILLMPADAQQGNWLSWHDKKVSWTVKDGSSTRTVTVADLLAQTVFYKVGHHASHNGTMQQHGLAMMTRKRELTAFIPVDRAVALGRNPKGSWRMPARGLYRALLDACEGRVVRSDLGWADDAAHAKEKSVERELRGLAAADEWRTWKRAQEAATHVTVTPLYIDFTLE